MNIQSVMSRISSFPLNSDPPSPPVYPSFLQYLNSCTLSRNPKCAIWPDLTRTLSHIYSLDPSHSLLYQHIKIMLALALLPAVALAAYVPSDAQFATATVFTHHGAKEATYTAIGPDATWTANTTLILTTSSGIVFAPQDADATGSGSAPAYFPKAATHHKKNAAGAMATAAPIALVAAGLPLLF